MLATRECRHPRRVIPPFVNELRAKTFNTNHFSTKSMNGSMLEENAGWSSSHLENLLFAWGLRHRNCERKQR
jgi:hypothetical protein